MTDSHDEADLGAQWSGADAQLRWTSGYLVYRGYAVVLLRQTTHGVDAWHAQTSSTAIGKQVLVPQDVKNPSLPMLVSRLREYIDRVIDAEEAKTRAEKERQAASTRLFG